MRRSRKNRMAAALLACAFTLALCAAPAHAQTLQEYAESAAVGSSPYLISVNTRENVVTVYKAGEDGFYSVPVRSMICSCGKASSATPHGTFSIYGQRYEWRRMVDGSYGQYAVRFNGSILFHSVCYYDSDPSRLMSYEYDALGTNVSLGCVRLQVADAKWIYDNCPEGTTVHVSAEDGQGPLGRPDRYVDSISGTENEGWDPTDPREENPWRALLGEYAESGAAGNGASDGGASANSDPSANALPFADVRESDWFYGSVLWCSENSVLKGTGKGFEPYASVSRSMLWQMIYQLAGEPDLASGDEATGSNGPAGESSDSIAAGSEGAASASQSPWYSNAREWCAKYGAALFSGEDGAAIPASRLEFVTALYRFHLRFRDANPESCGDLSVFADAQDLSREAAQAFSWAVGAGIVKGDTDASGERTLRPEDGLIRAELAALLQRYGEKR